MATNAGAAIAKADVIQSAFAAFRFSLVGFALPFSFVLRPELLMLSPENTNANAYLIVANVTTTLVAIVGLSASIAGHAFKPLAGWQSLLLLVLSLTVFFTRWQDAQLFAHMASVVLIAVVVAMNSRSRPARAMVETKTV